MRLKMTVAEKVKVYRLKKAWSQEQLAEIASISVRTVQRTEKGQKPGLETLSSLASAFEVNVSELMADAGDESNKLNECKKDVRKQVAQELRFYWILTRFVLSCTLLLIINYLYTPDSYWSVIVSVLWGFWVTLRGIRVFLIKDELDSLQQSRLKTLWRSITHKIG